VRFLKPISLLTILVVCQSSALGSRPPEGLGPLEGKVVWVDFWASWCAPCRRSFPWLNEMQRRYASQGLQIIAINVDKERKLANRFLAENRAEFTVRFDPAGKLAEQFGVEAMPSSYVLDAAGNLLEKHLGFRLADEQRYEEGIKTALAAQSASEDRREP
jgi:cytochrome c biogenesis protein CcmG/thiol:disulfide interchange protein DsbE